MKTNINKYTIALKLSTITAIAFILCYGAFIIMNRLFNIGDTLYGFCNGYFGRDDYDTKLCIMITPKYAVFQYLDGEFEGNATVLNNPERLDKETVDEWKVL